MPIKDNESLIGFREICLSTPKRRGRVFNEIQNTGAKTLTTNTDLTQRERNSYSLSNTYDLLNKNDNGCFLPFSPLKHNKKKKTF